MSNTKIDRSQKIEALNQAAMSLNQGGETRTALKLLQRSLKLKPENAQTHVLLGITYQNLGNLELAETHLRQAVEIDPDYAEGMQTLGLFLILREEPQEGAEWLLKFLERTDWQEETSIESYVNCLKALDRYGEAKQNLRKAWEITHHFEVGRKLFDLQWDDKEYKEAGAILEIITFGTGDQADYRLLGLTYKLAKSYFKAIWAYRQAIHIIEEETSQFEDPMSVEIDEEKTAEEVIVDCYMDIAECYLALKDGENALRAVEAAEEVYGEPLYDVMYDGVKADTLVMLGRYQEAETILRSAIESVGESDDETGTYVSLYINLANIVGRDSPTEKLAILREGLAKFPNGWLLNFFYCDYLIAQGFYAEVLTFTNRIMMTSKYRYFSFLHHLEALFRIHSDDDSLAASLDKIFVLFNEEEFRNMVWSLTNQISDLGQERDKIEFLKKVINRLADHIPGMRIVQRLQGWLALEREDGLAAIHIFEYLLRTHEGEEHKNLQDINNLACAYLLCGKYERADQLLNSVIEVPQEKSDEKPEWLYKMICWNGAVVSFSPPYPSTGDTTRSLVSSLVAKANLAAISLVLGEDKLAADLAREILVEKPEDELGYVIFASVAVARQEKKTAVDLLTLALKYSKGVSQEKIEGWLNSLM